MLKLPAIQEFAVAEDVTAFFLERLAAYKRDGFTIPVERTETVNGVQTPNILTLHDPAVDEHLAGIKRLLEQGTSIRFAYHWAHLIDYDIGGYQRVHDHAQNEDYSFILYLNSSRAGQTTFLLNPDPDLRLALSVSPTKNNLVLFLAQMRHEGKPVIGGKQVLVGGLRMTGVDAPGQAWSLEFPLKGGRR